MIMNSWQDYWLHNLTYGERGDYNKMRDGLLQVRSHLTDILKYTPYSKNDLLGVLEIVEDSIPEEDLLHLLTVGRIVHFENGSIEPLAALIVQVVDHAQGIVDLLTRDPIEPERRARYSAQREIGTWHWIEDV